MKKVIIIVSAILSFFVISIIGLFIFYKSSLEPTGSASEGVQVTIENGVSSRNIVDTLYNSGLLKNKYAGYLYMKLQKDSILQAGLYDLNKGMSFPEIIDIICNGKVVDNSISVTFVEGKRLVSYAKKINETFGYSEEEILNTLQDKEYLQELIDKYWFLTDAILNDNLYYALEGYLYPDTYLFAEDASIKDVIEKMLNETSNKLSDYKDEIEKSGYSVHELLTMASIVELEGANSDDRKGVAGVFYNRLKSGWSLGSDVTTYYGAKIEMSERDLYDYEINEVNNYNTRPAAMAGKLPIGPICSPGFDAIVASLEPAEHNYYYFVADKNKKTYYNVDLQGHIETINKLKKEGLWYVYE